MKKPTPDLSMCEGWDNMHYETVCVLIDQNSISDDEIMDDVVPAFFEIGQIVSGDNCSFTRNGDVIVIGRLTWAYRTGKHSIVH